MYAIGILLVFLVGYLTVFNLSTLTSRLERIGLAFPVGMGAVTAVMALMDICGIPLAAPQLLAADAVLALALAALLIPKRKKVAEALGRSVDFGGFNFVWLLLLAVVVWIEYANFQKCMFFPTYDRDSLAAFDTMGFVAAQEHTYGAMSIFAGDYMPGIHAPGSPIAYYPLVQLAYTYVYALGAETSKIVPALTYLSFLVAFYGALSRLTSRTAAMAATLFTLMAPDMLAFSSLSGTNVVNAVYASLGLIYVLWWKESGETQRLALGALLLAINVWSRAEGLAFVLAAGALVLYACLRTRKWKPLAIIASCAVPVVLWQVYTRVFGMTLESAVITHPYFDGEKLSTVAGGAWALLTNTAYYGWTFPVLLAAVLADAWFMVRRRNGDAAKLFAIVCAMALYFAVLYQIDYKWDSISNVLSYSAKRFMFCFVPLAWYFVATSGPVKGLMTKFDAWMSK
jgi:hypothetical protein